MIAKIYTNHPEVHVLMNMERMSHPEVFQHSERVAKIVEFIIENDKSNILNPNKEEIIIGALLHDIGKLYMPFNLIQSPMKYTEIETAIIHTHTSAGYKVVQQDFSDIVKDIVYLHHEENDGRGYPLGLKKINIPDYVQIVSVADKYEALTAKRIYKEPLSHEETIKILKKSKITQEYVKIVDIFGAEYIPEQKRIEDFV